MFAIGDPDVVVPACISCDGRVVRVDPVGVVVDMDVVVVSIVVVDVVVMVVGLASINIT